MTHYRLAKNQLIVGFNLQYNYQSEHFQVLGMKVVIGFSFFIRFTLFRVYIVN